MNDVFSLWLGLSPEMSIRCGVTLLHFLWQGAVVGLLAFVAAKLLRHQAAVVRYWLHSVALIACPLCVVMTFALVEIPEEFQVSKLPESTAIPELPGPLANGHLASQDVPYPVLSEVAPAAIVTQNLNEATAIAETTASIAPTFNWLPVVAQWMTILYAAGVLCFLIRLGVALRGGQRLRAISRPMSDSSLRELVHDQAKRIGLRIVPVVAYCDRVAVPTVIGILRPVILLPATLMTGLLPEEFSSILSHELAHIRRYDLWINLLQRLIESVLFFHPVVWFLSRRLSVEREICCDDLVVRCGHEPMHYAGALLRMAELCVAQNGTKLAALSADGQSQSELERRIQRLMNLRHGSGLRLTRVGVMIIAIATMSSAVASAMFSAWAQSDVSAETQAAAVAVQERDLPFEWSIPGTVKDGKGKPVAGALIETLPGLQEQVSTTSADNGQFVLEMRSKSPQGIPFVVSSSDGTLKSFVKGIDYDSPPALTRVVLKPARNITVTVKDMAGIAQNGATIGAIGDLLIDSATTDEQGRATLRIPADAEIEWIFGYLNHTGFDYYENYNAFPTEERLALPDQITLTLAGVQNVKVRVIDSDEKPVSGVKVLPWIVMAKGKLSYINFSSLPNLATTDDSGIAEFPWIPAGLERGVSFLIRHPKYHCPKLPEYESTESGMTARVLRVASVRGKVTLADGTPVSGVRLQAEGRGNTTRYFRGHTTTHSDGTYEFDIYPDQNTIVAITDTGYAAKSHMDVLLKEGQSREDVDFVVSDGTLIRGTITLGKDRHPAAGDTARLIQSSGGTDLVRWNNTDTNGRYRFRVGPGVYELRLPNQEAEAPIMVNVKNEEEVVYDGHAERRSRVNLRGIVTDASGTPVADCKIYGESIAAPGHAGFQTTTNAEGKFNSERWSDSMLVYAIQGKKMLAGYTEISEDSTDVAVKLAPATAASGIVRRKDGQPVANVRVQLNIGLPRAEGQCNLNLWTTTDEDGGYAFNGLLPGTLCSVTMYRADQHTNGPKFEVNDLGSVVLDDVVIASVPVAALLPNAQSGHEPNQVPDAAPMDGRSEEAVTVRYPYCIVETENLRPRPLPEAIADVNRTSLESPTGVAQPPVTDQETRDAIARFAAKTHVPEAVRDQLKDILKTGTLPSNVYFRRFTRLDDGRQMQEVWWVRLVVETSDGPVYSVPVRTTALRARPYTQMERQQNAADGLTLINRFSSYFEEPSNILLLEEFPSDSVARLVSQAEAAINGKDLKLFESLFEWKGTSDTTREFVASEFQTLLESTIDSIKVSPRNFRGHLIHWSAFQHYQPNLEIVGYLDIEYTNAGDDAGVRKTLSLEMGKSGDEFRLVNYMPQGERNLPTGTVEGLSIRGHIEPLEDGTHLITDVITNPGTLLSAHLANEEVRQRDFSKYKPDTGAATDPGELPPSEPADHPKPTVPQRESKLSLNDEQRHEFLLKTVADADRIPDEQARQKAQWDLVHPLVQMGLLDDAFRQAMKLKANPQTCIYSLTTLAEDAMKRGDQATVQKAWDAARKANTDSGTKHNHYVIQLGFKLNRTLAEILATASTARKADEQRAYLDIRNELTWRGRLDEAYEVTAAYLSKIPKEISDREMAYYCSHAKSFDYYAKHDHYGQAIRIIEQMPKGKHRDAAIVQLIDGLLVVANKDTVPKERLAIADNWVGQIEDRISQAAMKARILAHRLPSMSVEELEQRIAHISSREEKSEYLRRIFQKLLEEDRFDEADRILARQILVIKEQPREEVKSKFGNVNDDDAVLMITWTHHRELVLALHRAGRMDEARTRLEAMKDLPDSEPKFLIGNLAGMRLQLYMELGDFDSVEKIAAEKPNPVGTIGMAAWMMKKGQFDRGWKHVAPLADAPSESFFPPKVGTQGLYFAAQPFVDLATELFKVNRPNDALTFMNKLPESRDTAHAFETFGDLLVTSGRLGELDQWLARLSNETARTHTRLGALRTITKPSEAAKQP